MFPSLLTGQSARPAQCASASESLPVVAPALPALRAPRPSAAAVQVEVSQTADGRVIRVKGEARAECAGVLLEGLLVPEGRAAVVILDLSELHSISSIAVGVLAAYRRSVVRTGGRIRLTGVLQPTVKESLVRAEVFDPDEIDTAHGSGPTGSLTPEQERRLAELMGRWWLARDSGNTLPPVEQDELEALARAGLRDVADEAGW
jgi:anti-anti-sigma regulatory factor